MARISKGKWRIGAVIAVFIGITGCTTSQRHNTVSDSATESTPDTAVDGSRLDGASDSSSKSDGAVDAARPVRDVENDDANPTDAIYGISDASADRSTDASVQEAATDTTVDLSNRIGLIQKGPFIRGTNVKLQELDEALVPTGRTFIFETVDDLGLFNIPSYVASRYVEIIATGYYFDEISGQLSGAELTLRTISALTVSATVNVNLLTTLTASRERALVANGKSFLEARSQAESEVLSALSFSAGSSTAFDQMDLSKTGDANAILLAASVALEQLGYLRNPATPVAELLQLLAKIGTDIADNGLFDDLATASMLRCIAPAAIDPVAIRQRLQSHYGELDAGVTLPDFEPLLALPQSCCIPDRRRCFGDTVQTCDATGRWQDSVVCGGSTPFCNQAFCEPPCTAGDRRCVPVTAQTCDSAGRWQENGVCQWSAPIELESYARSNASASSHGWGVPKLGVDNSGQVTVVWEGVEGTRSSIRASRYLPGTGWQPAQNLDQGDAWQHSSAPDLAVSPSGEVLVVWRQELINDPGTATADLTLLSNQYHPDTGWESTRKIVEDLIGLVNPPKVIFAKDIAIALWFREWELHSSRLMPGSGWTAPITLGNNPGTYSWFTPIAVSDSGGNASAAWWKPSLAISQYTASNTGWTAQPAVLGYGEAESESIALDSNGNGLVAWVRANNDSDTYTFDLLVSRYSNGVGWSVPETLFNAPTIEGPKVAFDSRGNAIVAYRSIDDKGLGAIQAFRYGRDRGWGQKQNLTTPDSSRPLMSQMVIDVRDHATVLSTSDGQVNEGLYVTRDISNSGWTTPERIDARSDGISYDYPTIVTDSRGHLTVLWREVDTGPVDTREHRIRAMRFE